MQKPGQLRARHRCLGTDVGGACSSRMSDEHKAREEAARSEDDDERTEQAKGVVDEYAVGLREMLRRLRRWFH